MSEQNTENKDESEEAGPSSTAVATALIQQTGDIFKLDIDCFEEVFDFLPLEDLVSVGSTCKRLQQVAGYCFQQNYSDIDAFISEDDVLTDGEIVNCFIPFINSIFFDSEESLEFFDGRQSKFVRLKRMTFLELMITSNIIDCVKNRLSKLEFLRIDACGFDGNVYEMLLKFCTNLKRLTIQNTYQFDDAGNDWLLKSSKLELMITSNEIDCVKNRLSKLEFLRIDACGFNGNVYEMLLKFCTNLKRLIISEFDASDDWLLKNYPKLEYFEFAPREKHARNELLSFFELNPTIRMFATGAKLLRNNKAKMMSGKVKLDDLAIYVDLDDGSESRRFCEMLNEMYDLGVYKRLHMYFDDEAKQEMIDELPTLKSLVKLYIGSHSWKPDTMSLPNLNDLQEIHIDLPKNIIKLEDMPDKFPNLKRVYLKYANSTQLLMFISQAVNLMRIKFYRLGNGPVFLTNDEILDLVALNKERQKLNEAEKVTIYVDKKVYLSTKWAMKGTDFSHIVMRRATSHSWNHSFYHES